MIPPSSILLRTEDSADAVAVVEVSVPPGWEGPPLHHHAFDETFYVLDGELTFQLNDELATRTTGQLTFAPRDSIHTLANLTDRPARYLLICTPGGFERRFDPDLGGSISADKPYLKTHVVGATIPERLRSGA